MDCKGDVAVDASLPERFSRLSLFWMRPSQKTTMIKPASLDYSAQSGNCQWDNKGVSTVALTCELSDEFSFYAEEMGACRGHLDVAM